MAATTSPPDFSIVVPAYNEQQWLRRSLPALHAAMQAVGMAGEIVVVDNNSSDGTARVAAELGARVVFEPVNQISRARNLGARRARGRFLVFVDADTLLQPRALRQALENLAGGKCCGGGSCIEFDPPARGAARWFVDFWNAVAPRVGWAAGCFLYCRRDAFEQVGGFSEKVYASEELWLSWELVRWGLRRGRRFEVIREPKTITSARKLEHPWRMWPWFLLILVFPPAIRYRRMCGIWYRRTD